MLANYASICELSSVKVTNLKFPTFQTGRDNSKRYVNISVGEGGYFCPVAVLSEGVVRALRRGVAGMGGVYQR